MKFLLRFNDPLEVVQGYWESEITGYDHSGEMSHMLWDIQDRGLYSEDQLVQLGNEAHSRGKNAMTENYDHIELFEKPALFSNFRIDRSTVPDGWHCYDIRGSDDDPGDLSTVEFRVIVNHSGTILCPDEIDFPEKKDYRPINGDINFIGESVTVAEFCEQHHIPVPSPSVAMKQPQKKNRSNAYER